MTDRNQQPTGHDLLMYLMSRFNMTRQEALYSMRKVWSRRIKTMSVLKDIIKHMGFVTSEQVEVLAKDFPRMKLIIKVVCLEKRHLLAM